MRSILALACISLAAPAFAASLDMANGYGWSGAARDITPERLGQLFCSARLSGDMAPVAPFFADKLQRLLAATPAADVPWQAFPDPPTGCTVSIVNGYSDTIGVLVEISYRAEAHTWSDTLNLERTPDSWRLNNVFYAGGGNLRFRLLDAAP